MIYHRGHLAARFGNALYLEFDNGQHLANYYAQTVAHNCVLIHQPGEPPAGLLRRHGRGKPRRTAPATRLELKQLTANDRYVYVAGDATACYRHGARRPAGQKNLPEKCTLATRQIVFLMPNHFVIFDRVATTDPAYRKQWLLHGP